MNPIILHINFMECDWLTLSCSIDEIVKKAVEWGYDGIEFRGVCPANFSGTEEEYLKEVATAAKKYGLKHPMFNRGAENCSSADAAVRAETIRKTADFYKRAQEVAGTSIFNACCDMKLCPDGRIIPGCYDFGGSYMGTEDDWKYTVDTYQQIAKEIEPLGIKVAFETHMNYLHDRPETSKKLVDLIGSPSFGINMDYGNTVYLTNVPSAADCVELYGDKLYYLHLKNSSLIQNWHRLPTSLAEGDINHRPYLAKIKEVGFTGPIAIEAPRNGDREWFARQDLAYFKQLASEIGL